MSQQLADRQRELRDRFFDIWDRKSPEEKQTIIQSALNHVRKGESGPRNQEPERTDREANA
jgi:hypothetical protein